MAQRVPPTLATPQVCRELWTKSDWGGQWGVANVHYVVLRADSSGFGKCNVVIANQRMLNGVSDRWFNWIGELDPKNRIFSRKTAYGDFSIILEFDPNLTSANAEITLFGSLTARHTA